MTFLLDNLLLIGLALVSGGLLLWPLIRGNGGAKALSPLEATQLINHDNAVVVDLRDEKEFMAGTLAGARNVPLAKLTDGASEIARLKARPVVLVCGAGQQSTGAVARFNALGFERAFALAGGIAAWKQAGLPLVQPGRDTSRVAPKDGSRKQRQENRSDRSKGNRPGRGAAPGPAPGSAGFAPIAASPSTRVAAATLAPVVVPATSAANDGPEAAIAPIAAVEPVSSAAATTLQTIEPRVADAAGRATPVAGPGEGPESTTADPGTPATTPRAKELS